MLHSSSLPNGNQQGSIRRNCIRIPSVLFTTLPYHQTTTTTTTDDKDNNNDDCRRWNSYIINPSSGKIDILASALEILSTN